MIGLSTLIDSLLAANAGRRVDVAAIKPETEVGATGEVPMVERAENEVRLPTRAAMERLLPSAVSDAPKPPGRSGAGAPAPSVEFEWSAAARIIRSVLAQARGDAAPMHSTAPLWPRATSTTALAGSLAGMVEHSGLFYESHLAQFAVGARSLAQMQAEPQARWAGAGSAAASSSQPAAEAPAHAASSASAASSAQVMQSAQSAQWVAATPLSTNAPTLVVPMPPEDIGSTEPASAPGSGAQPAASPTPDASRMQAAYRLSSAATLTGGSALNDAAQTAHIEFPSSHAAGVGATSSGADTDALSMPQAVTLIHQQLDLLATSVFRWNGQAWPGVPMAWSIQAPQHEPEHEQEGDAAGANEQTPSTERVWFTTLSMQLPRLGAVDVRLGVAGDAVQANLTASDDAATQLAAGGRPALAGRMEAAGLQLREFQVRAAAETTPSELRA